MGIGKSVVNWRAIWILVGYWSDIGWILDPCLDIRPLFGYWILVWILDRCLDIGQKLAEN